MDPDTPISKLDQEAESQTVESGLGEESFTSSFPLGVSETDTNDVAYTPLLPPHPSTDLNAIQYPLLPQDYNLTHPHIYTQAQDDNNANGHTDSGHIVQESSPYPAGAGASGGFLVQDDPHVSFSSPILQELSRKIKIAIAYPNQDVALLHRLQFLITSTLKHLDNQFIKKKQQLKKSTKRIDSLQFSLNQKEAELDIIKQEKAASEKDDNEYIESLEGEVKMLSTYINERQGFGVKINPRDREKLAELEKQIYDLKKHIKELEADNEKKQKMISDLEKQNETSKAEIERYKLEKNLARVDQMKRQLLIPSQRMMDIVEETCDRTHLLYSQLAPRPINPSAIHCDSPDITQRRMGEQSCTQQSRQEFTSALVDRKRTFWNSKGQSFPQVTVESCTMGIKVMSLSTPAPGDHVLFEIGAPGENEEPEFVDTGYNFEANTMLEDPQNGSISYDVEILPEHMSYLAAEFDCLELLAPALRLLPAQIAESRTKVVISYRDAVYYCLNCWWKRNPTKATYEKLIQITQKLKRGDIARKIKEYFHKNDISLKKVI